MCILTGGGNAHSSRPIEVHVGQLVAQLLELISFQWIDAAFFQNDKVGGSDGALGHGLGHEEKVLEREPGE